MLGGTEVERDRQAHVGPEMELPALVAPDPFLLERRVGLTGAVAGGGILATARRLLVGERLQWLDPQRVDLEREDVPAGHLLHRDGQPALGVGGGQDPGVVVLDGFG
jgi:hypothetical protein